MRAERPYIWNGSEEEGLSSGANEGERKNGWNRADPGPMVAFEIPGGPSLNSIHLEHLAWDTALFGFPVGRIQAASLQPEILGQTLKGLHAGIVRLVYVSADWRDGVRRRLIEDAGGKLVDRKLTFCKPLTPPAPPWPPAIAACQDVEPGPRLEALALASGIHSRFRLDPRIPSSVFEELFLQWIRRSLRKEIADAVLVSAGDSSLVTLKMENDGAAIGLLAVEEQHRRRGLGRALLAASEAWALDRGADCLKVVTQGGNDAACALYLSAGFTVAREEALFHLWTTSF